MAQIPVNWSMNRSTNRFLSSAVSSWISTHGGYSVADGPNKNLSGQQPLSPTLPLPHIPVPGTSSVVCGAQCKHEKVGALILKWPRPSRQWWQALNYTQHSVLLWQVSAHGAGPVWAWPASRLSDSFRPGNCTSWAKWKPMLKLP